MAGIHGHPVKLVTMDDALNPATSHSQVTHRLKTTTYSLSSMDPTSTHRGRHMPLN